MGLIIFLIVLMIIAFIVFFIVLGSKVKLGNDFRNNSEKITIGMTTEEVKSIMGEPSYTKNYSDNSFEYIYEKSEWKGWARGGTKTRRMEIVFSKDKKVISIAKNKNCDMSGW